MKRYLFIGFMFICGIARADSSLNQLIQESTAASTDLFYKMDSPGSGNLDRSISFSSLENYFVTAVSTSGFIWNQNSLQSGSTFYVSSGTINGQATIGTLQGAGLATCGSSNQALSWTGGSFGCQTIIGSGGGAVLNSTQTFSGINTFSSSVIIASGTVQGQLTVGSLVGSANNSLPHQSRVIFSTFTVASTTANSSFIPCGPSITITPMVLTSTVCVNINIILSNTNGNSPAYATIYRNGTNLAGTNTMSALTWPSGAGGGGGATVPVGTCDHPNTTSPVTYQLYFLAQNNTAVCGIGEMQTFTATEYWP